MGTPRIDRAAELVDELTSDGIRATLDPQQVAASLPCVLVAPPRIVWGRLGGGPSEVVWRLLVLANGGPSLGSWRELDALLDALDGAGYPIETAESGSYAVGGQQIVACYVATWTDDT